MFTIFSLPLPTKIETIKVVIHDDAKDKYVLTIALVWPSSTAVAELNDGLNVLTDYIDITLNNLKENKIVYPI